jgi:hypothetical protein
MYSMNAPGVLTLPKLAFPKRPAGSETAPSGPAGIQPRPRLAVCGAHGGAGTTTLARLLGPADDLGAVRLEPLSRALAGGGLPGPLVLACRPNTWSAELATAAVSALTGAGHQVAAVAIVGDGWPETAVAAARYRLLSARCGAVVRVPFVPALRGCPDPAGVRLPRGARGALARIRLAAAGTATAPAVVPEQARPMAEDARHEEESAS